MQKIEVTGASDLASLFLHEGCFCIAITVHTVYICIILCYTGFVTDGSDQKDIEHWKEPTVHISGGKCFITHLLMQCRQLANHTFYQSCYNGFDIDGSGPKV